MLALPFLDGTFGNETKVAGDVAWGEIAMGIHEKLLQSGDVIAA